MHLSGEVPGRIAQALKDPAFQAVLTRGADVRDVDGWAVHAGGKSILDAVAQGLDLDEHALDLSRAVLRDFGNMSSATLMFALAKFARKQVKRGVAMAFGPGLAAEGFGFRSVI
jgi:alpha-pyrone synthase